MPRDRTDDDWDDDELNLAEDDDQDREDDDDRLIDCPVCGKSIYEEAEQCPKCGTYLDGTDAPPQRRPLWIGLGVALCLLIIFFWIFCGAMGFH